LIHFSAFDNGLAKNIFAQKVRYRLLFVKILTINSWFLNSMAEHFLPLTCFYEQVPNKQYYTIKLALYGSE
jgi:hypothetical protein